MAGVGKFDPKHDEPLAREALVKLARGEEPTRDEARALKRFEGHQAEQARWRAYEAIPKKDYKAMSGLTDRGIANHRDLYGLSALDGPTVNLSKLLREFHGFLIKHGSRLGPVAGDDALLIAGLEKGSPAAERYRGYKADLAHLELEERRGTLLPRSETRRGMQEVSAIIRGGLEALERECGPLAVDVMTACLDEADARITSMFEKTGPENEAETDSEETES
jgi:hypothetical protein